MKSIDYIGYIINSNNNVVTVVLPEKPFGKLKCMLKQKDKLVGAEFYDKYELKGFTLELDDDNNVVDWKFKNVRKCVTERNFVALLADQRIVADDGKAYRLWDHKLVKSDEWVSQFDWAFSSRQFNSVNNITLLIKDGVIYGTECKRNYRFRESWSIEDSLANYLNSYDRYIVDNIEEVANKSRDALSVRCAMENYAIDHNIPYAELCDKVYGEMPSMLKIEDKQASIESYWNKWKEIQDVLG